MDTDSNIGAKRRQFRCRDMAASSDTLSPVAKAIKNMAFRRRFNGDAFLELKRGDFKSLSTLSNDHCGTSCLGGGLIRKQALRNARSSSGSRVNPVKSLKGYLIAVKVIF